jgi:hypothetical protein
MITYILGSFILAVLFLVLISLTRVMLEAKGKRSAESRGLFEFSNGVRIVAVDPIEVVTAMEEHDRFRFDVHPTLLEDGDKEAIAITVDAVRHAFGVPAYHSPKQPGLTNKECIALYDAFCIWLARQKKSTESVAT